jgi:hypothetical protein
MKVTFVIYNFDQSLSDAQAFYRHLEEDLLGGIDPLLWGIDVMNLVCRAAITSDHHQNGVNIYLREDDLPPLLRWHQRPEIIFKLLQDLDSDIIHAFSLGLPLHFRWLRKLLGPEVGLVAHHTGERHWIQMRLWMQQFGLRVVNGFVFHHDKDAQDWRKAALVLPAQPVVSLDNGHRLPERDLLIPQMYRELTTRESV